MWMLQPHFCVSDILLQAAGLRRRGIGQKSSEKRCKIFLIRDRNQVVFRCRSN